MNELGPLVEWYW